MLSAIDIWTLALACREDEGATVDPYTGELIDLEDAAFHEEDYFVSIPSHEYECCEDRLLADITSWVNAGAAEDAARNGYYIGLWWETPSTLVLDLTDVQHGEAEALAVGKARKQKAIFHIASKTCIEVGDKVAG